jgi:Fe-S-cluster-containing dehydrogenase component/DMSO reductase anchor subunit
MNTKYFLFDLNKCVGCHACIVACSIENQTNTELQWREVTSFNPLGYPDIPLFHLSLACNHCKDSPCMENCPALAYSIDKITGAIIHHPEKCIGCKYCTWACPYDAPKYNPKTRIIEKCTFCNHRLLDSKKPACTNLCPTGALDFIDSPENMKNQNVSGFTEIGIEPSIKIIPPKKDKPTLVCSESKLITKPEISKKLESKIKLRNEWPLVIFTLITMLLVSVFTASLYTPLQINISSFIVLAGTALVLSMFHLGKKFRAWRSVLNLKNSWLSREILAFILFVALSCLYLLYIQDRSIAYAAVVFGIICLFSIDKVYQIAIQPIKFEIHSAHVLLSFFLFTAIFLQQYYAFTVIALIKTAIYTYRKIEMNKQDKNIRLFLSGLRIDLLISVPFFFWIFEITNIQWWIFASILIGEIIDRCEYYDELDVITPGKQLEQDMK